MATKIRRKVLETIGVMVRSKPLKACIMMTLGLCFHFLGYECARAASITLLAAKEVGLGNEAIPLTIALGSPLSGVTLYLYTKSIKKYGSKFTLRVSFLVCIVFMALITAYAQSMTGFYGKAAIVAFYAFREIYVSLLSSQQWAFIAGTLNKSTSSYIVVFSGIVSVASAVGGCLIEQLVGLGGVQALLSTALFAAIAGCVCAEVAYTLSDVAPPAPSGHSAHTAHASETTTTTAISDSKQSTQGSAEEGRDGLRRRRPAGEQVAPTKESHHASASANREPEPNQVDSITDKPHSSAAAKTENTQIHHSSGGKKRGGFWSDSWNLICTHRLLQILFVEGLLHQMCGNMLNLMFHNGLRLEIQDDATRARLVGRFFATVNVTSCALQCFVLPHILSHSTLATILARMPVFVLLAACYGVVSPGLISVMLGFGTIKVLEYSIMHSASEMIYMPMGHEVRYLGKELIRFFGHKLGKSASSLVLSALVSQLQPSLAMQSSWGAILTLCWGASMVALANRVRERDHEEERELQRSARAKASTSTAGAAAEISATRRKARSFSYDDYAVRHSSNSKATARIPAPTPVAAGRSHSSTTSKHLSGLKRAVGSTGPSAPRSISLDQTQPPKDPRGVLGDLSANGLVWEEDVPVHPANPDQAAPAARAAGHDRDTHTGEPAHASDAPSLPPLPEADCIDTITDASGSPEASVSMQSQRSHGDSVDSIVSLGQEYERGESFSEGLASTFTPGELGIDGEDEDLAYRRSLSSADSLASLASRERRVSWERDQRQREGHHAHPHAQERQPVMLRVGSVSVSLNTFNAMANSRNRQQNHSP